MDTPFLDYTINEPIQYKQSVQNLGLVFSDFEPQRVTSFKDIEPQTDSPSAKEEIKLDNQVTQQPVVTTTVPVTKPTTKEETVVKTYGNSKKDNFNKIYDELEAENPIYSKYRRLLTDIASKESGFNSSIQNRAGAPAYGYFQFMQDGKKWNNIQHYSGLSIEDFRKNPKEQIKAAVKLAQDFEKGLSSQDLEKAKQQGYSINALIAGAWLGGNGGVRRALNGRDTSDKHWSKTGAGTTVKTRMNQFNYLNGGKLLK